MSPNTSRASSSPKKATRRFSASSRVLKKRPPSRAKWWRISPYSALVPTTRTFRLVRATRTRSASCGSPPPRARSERRWRRYSMSSIRGRIGRPVGRPCQTFEVSPATTRRGSPPSRAGPASSAGPAPPRTRAASGSPPCPRRWQPRSGQRACAGATRRGRNRLHTTDRSRRVIVFPAFRFPGSEPTMSPSTLPVEVVDRGPRFRARKSNRLTIEGTSLASLQLHRDDGVEA